MKVRNSSPSRPVVISLFAGLLCCVPTASRPAQRVSRAVTGDSTSLREQAPAVSGFVADSVVCVANATRCLLSAAHKVRRRRRRWSQPSRAGSQQEFLPQPPLAAGRAWRERACLPGCGDHFPRPFRIVPRYRITTFRPTVKKKNL